MHITTEKGLLIQTGELACAKGNYVLLINNQPCAQFQTRQSMIEFNRTLIQLLEEAPNTNIDPSAYEDAELAVS